MHGDRAAARTPTGPAKAQERLFALYLAARPHLERVRPGRGHRLIAKAHPVVRDGITLGEYSYCLGRVHRYAGDHTTRVTIGRYTSIAESVALLAGGEHRTDWVSTSPIRLMMGLPGALHDGLPTSRGDITIGNDVWVGRGATILSGTTVGDGAVIGAGAVVRGNVRPYAIVVGNPARELRIRFADAQVDALLRIAWWNWPHDKVAENVALLSSGDVDGFIRAHDVAAQSSAGAPR